MNNCILVDHVSKQYKDFLLNDISFTLEQGYILGLIGKNGAGKTTLIEGIAGKRKMDRGNIQICGIDMHTDGIHAKQKMGLITEPGILLPMRTLSDNAVLLGAFYEDFSLGLFQEKIQQYGLHGNQKYCELSRGMKVRFQLAFALAHKPEILIMDEPTGGLDPVFRKEFLSIIQSEVRDRNMSAIFSTHITSDLDKVADYIMMLDRGEVRLKDDKETLLDDYPLIQGTAENLDKIPQVVLGRVRKTHGTFTTILKEPGFLRINPEVASLFQIERTTIENIMYYLSEPEIESGVKQDE